MLSWSRLFRRDTSPKDWLKALSPPSLESIPINTEDLRSSLVLRFCSLFSLCTSLIGLFQSLLQIYIIYLGQNFHTMYHILAHLYLLAGGILIITIELEWQIITMYFHFFDIWIGRGLFLLLNGTILSILQDAKYSHSLQSLRHICIVLLTAFGLIYITFGVLCIRQLKEREILQVRGNILDDAFHNVRVVEEEENDQSSC